MQILKMADALVHPPPIYVSFLDDSPGRHLPIKLLKPFKMVPDKPSLSAHLSHFLHFIFSFHLLPPFFTFSSPGSSYVIFLSVCLLCFLAILLTPWSAGGSFMVQRMAMISSILSLKGLRWYLALSSIQEYVP